MAEYHSARSKTSHMSRGDRVACMASFHWRLPSCEIICSTVYLMFWKTWPRVMARLMYFWMTSSLVGASASSGRNMAGFHRAPLAIMRESAHPTSFLNLSALLRVIKSPLAIKGMDRLSFRGRKESHLAAWAGRSCFSLAWTAIAAMPQSSHERAKSIVFCMVSSSRILQVTGQGRFLRSVLRMSVATRGVLSNAAPMPPFTEKLLGHPMLTSTAQTSCTTFCAPSSA
mmetsp:Transcript_28526/g.71251  ORF Transcript_28526/g.71251 Transcript_28526/m.71251 type:complete len:228 (-) Transcript_28526:384-1067(-)